MKRAATFLGSEKSIDRTYTRGRRERVAALVNLVPGPTFTRCST